MWDVSVLPPRASDLRSLQVNESDTALFVRFLDDNATEIGAIRQEKESVDVQRDQSAIWPARRANRHGKPKRINCTESFTSRHSTRNARRAGGQINRGLQEDLAPDGCRCIYGKDDIIKQAPDWKQEGIPQGCQVCGTVEQLLRPVTVERQYRIQWLDSLWTRLCRQSQA